MNRLAAIALLLITTATAFSPSLAEAKSRPTIDDNESMDCFLGDDGGDVDYSEGILISCCYDDGCWICEKNPGQNCVWDPKYRTIGPVAVPGTPIGTIKLRGIKALPKNSVGAMPAGQ